MTGGALQDRRTHGSGREFDARALKTDDAVLKRDGHDMGPADGIEFSLDIVYVKIHVSFAAGKNYRNFP